MKIRRQGLLDTTICDKVCQSLTAGQWFSLGTLVSSTNKTEILLKVALSTDGEPKFYGNGETNLIKTRDSVGSH
jgi:hypothetical protein